MPVTTTTLPPPTLPEFNLSNILSNMTEWWTTHTFGLFPVLLAGLFVFSVFLKTRSMSATLVAASVAAAVLGRENWLLLVAILALTGLLYGIWQRAAE